MSNFIQQRVIEIQVDLDRTDIIEQLEVAVSCHISSFEKPIRFAVTGSDKGRWTCELGTAPNRIYGGGIFEFNGRSYETSDGFNVVMLVPTGIGAAVGGHAGDATAAATLLSSVCDTLITHPNVFNASDVVQIPANALYVEGSLITQLMMGSVGLRRVRNNRLLVVVQAHEDELFTNAAINSVNAARASYGLDARIAEVDRRFRMISEHMPSGTAAGKIGGIEYLYDLLDARPHDFDAVAITSVIEIPMELHENYYRLVDDIVNPWGGVEAMLTHAVALKYGLPAAHAPMLESKAISEMDFGIVDARTAAEVVSMAFLQCVLRGLQAAPQITTVSKAPRGGVFQSEDISCLVIPDGCIGLPTLSALLNRIPVVAVRGNTNKMHNDLKSLPWQASQLHYVENYLEAAGVVAAIKAGITPSSVLRPLSNAPVHRLSRSVRPPILVSRAKPPIP